MGNQICPRSKIYICVNLFFLVKCLNFIPNFKFFTEYRDNIDKCYICVNLLYMLFSVLRDNYDRFQVRWRSGRQKQKAKEDEF